MDTYLRILNQMEALYPNASPDLLIAAARNAAATYLESHANQVIDLQERRAQRKKALAS